MTEVPGHREPSTCVGSRQAGDISLREEPQRTLLES
ncbi:uncharacterized protein SOCE26_049160 [Sorangium cellulosum]|uniref:Uncharacterized protein n=1 Tax=Sorangium cellulosum TaxID=56 RepID=A0A2L0EVY7_SORCE|nr:uncharacterized protein SOCE26_049160 [Sorangium cellulosum]